MAMLATSVVPTSHAENHALIMGVSAYVRSPLAGVPKDISHARELALSMSVPPSNIVVKRDTELTLDGMRQVLVDFAKQIKPGDRVFIYFSGHGTSYAGAAGKCEQAIVTQEMNRLGKDEFHQRIKPIIDQASKSFVFLDTCFSGGVIDRAKFATRDDEPMPQAKYFETKIAGDDSDCSRIANLANKSTRDFNVEAADIVPNYYLLASAALNEVAIDAGANFGSLATTALYQCAMSGSGADTDGDGVITLEEAKRCAQTRVDRDIRRGQARPGFPYTAMTLTSGGGPNAGAAPLSFQVTTTPASAPTSGERINSAALLDTIQRGADVTHQVQLRPVKTTFQISKDFLEMDLTSARGGYVTLFSVGSSGRIYQLFPNRIDPNNRIEAGTTLRLPRPEWKLRSRGPAGKNRMLAVVSSTPDRFAGLGLPDGPFANIENTASAAKAIIKTLNTPASGCVPSKRDFSVESNPCATSYGAARVDIAEVD